MSKCSIKNTVTLRILSISTLFFFLFQTVIFAESPQFFIEQNKCSAIQAPSFFTTDTYISQFKTELKFIKEMLLEKKEAPSYLTLNASLDACYEDYDRILNVKKPPVTNKNNSITVELELLKGRTDSDLMKRLKEMIDPVADEYDEKENTIKITYKKERAVSEKSKGSAPVHVRKEKYVSSFDGARITYDITGTGKEIIVLVHGWGGNKGAWDRFLNIITKKRFFLNRYTILTVDLRGFGSSELKGKDWRKNKKEIKKLFGTDRFLRSLYVKYCAHDLKRILLKEKMFINPGFKGVNIMGHSLGGMVAMQFALLFPRFTESLALIHTSSDPIHTFSPVTFLPGSTFIVKNFLKTLANITEMIVFLYEDIFVTQRTGLETILKAMKKMFHSIDHKLVNSVFDSLDEIPRLHSEIFEDKVPRKIEEIGDGLKNRIFGTLKKTSVFSWFLRTIVLDGEDQDVFDEIVEAFEKVRFYVLVQTFFALSFVNFPKKDLEELIKCPVLVVRGERDLVTGRKSVWARNIKGLRRLLIAPGKHMSPQEYPGDLADIIGWFLRDMEKGDVDESIFMDPETEERILAGEKVQINGKRAEQVALKMKDGIYAMDRIDKGLADIKKSLIVLMKEIDTEVSRELSSSFVHKGLMDYLSSTKEKLGKGDSYLYVKDGKIIGFLNLIVSKMRGKYMVHGRLAVLPEERDSGVGYGLLDHAIKVSQKKYKKFTGFKLVLFPGEKGYFKRYFKERTKNKMAGLSWYLESKELDDEDRYGFDVEIKRYTSEDKEMFVEKVIKKTNDYSRLVINSVIKGLATINNKRMPVDIIVDLSLVPAKDCKENMITWARLILNCRDMENVNFIFRDPKNLDIFDRSMDKDVCRVTNIPSKTRAIEYLRKAIINMADEYDLDGSMLEGIFNRCIYEDRRDNAVAIPIVSTNILNSAARKELKLKPDVFPVAMDGVAFIQGKGFAIRNYQAALAISLAKAALAIARKNSEKDFRDMMTDVLPRLNKLYKIFKDIELEEKDMDYMLDINPVQRLRYAIQLSIPKISRMPYDDLPVLHEAVNSCLGDA